MNKRIIYILSVLVLHAFPVASVYAEENVAPAAENYQIGPGDVINVSVWKEEGLQHDVLVKPDGGITFPLVGHIDASGLTTTELTTIITEKLSRFIPSPVVTVRVLQAMGNKVYVVGKVNRPGEYAATRYMDVLQALSVAGGLTPFADSGDIRVIRRNGESKQVFEFDYDDVISGDDLEANILLKAGDTVAVP